MTAENFSLEIDTWIHSIINKPCNEKKKSPFKNSALWPRIEIQASKYKIGDKMSMVEFTFHFLWDPKRRAKQNSNRKKRMKFFNLNSNFLYYVVSRSKKKSYPFQLCFTVKAICAFKVENHYHKIVWLCWYCMISFNKHFKAE